MTADTADTANFSGVVAPPAPASYKLVVKLNGNGKVNTNPAGTTFQIRDGGNTDSGSRRLPRHFADLHRKNDCGHHGDCKLQASNSQQPNNSGAGRASQDAVPPLKCFSKLPLTIRQLPWPQDIAQL